MKFHFIADLDLCEIYGPPSSYYEQYYVLGVTPFSPVRV
jgi:hypothetical protein